MASVLHLKKTLKVEYDDQVPEPSLPVASDATLRDFQEAVDKLHTLTPLKYFKAWVTAPGKYRYEAKTDQAPPRTWTQDIDASGQTLAVATMGTDDWWTLTEIEFFRQARSLLLALLTTFSIAVVELKYKD